MYDMSHIVSKVRVNKKSQKKKKKKSRPMRQLFVEIEKKGVI